MRVVKTPPSVNGDSPDIPPAIGRPSRFIHVGPVIENLTFTRKYSRAFHRKEDGTADETRPVIVAIETKKHPNGMEYEYDTPIWEGDIRVIGKYLAYKVSPSRRLDAPEWHQYVRAETMTNAPDAKPSGGLIAAMDLIQRKEHARWMEKLNVTLSGQTFRIAEFIRILALQQNPALILQSQGPIYLEDKTSANNCLLDGSLVFATRSRVFDTAGETREIITDLDHLPDKSNYYDLTPPDEITDDEIREGLELFGDSFGECIPKYAAIPAAFIGQLFSGWLAAIRMDFWSAIHLSGETGSGKSYYCLRFDAIQARNSTKSRGTITDLKPVLNWGDTTSTAKGPKYAVVNFGGFTITGDDVLKKGATDTEIRIQSDRVSNLIRSTEAGGGDLARVDRARNDVVAAESKMLHSSIRVPSEIPILKNSTLDRMIYLPHITDKWGSRNSAFVYEISDRLTSGHSREMMHRAYSAFVAWIFQKIPTDAQQCLEKAKAETETWGVSSRTADRYAAVLSGVFMLERFAAEYNVSMARQVANAVLALKECAREQSGANIPIALQWARDLRRAIANHKVAFPGPPSGNIHARAYSPIGVIVTNESPDGQKIETVIMPWDGATLEEFGMIPPAEIHTRADMYGYTIPPFKLRSNSGGRPPSNPLIQQWHIAVKKERFEDLCKTLSREYGYEPQNVMQSLRQLGKGDITNVTITGKSDRDKYWIFDAGLLRAIDDDDAEGNTE